MTAIASYIEFESEEEEYRYETISAGGVWAEIDEKKSERISVFWSSQHNQHDRLGLRLNAIGGKGRTNSGGYLSLSLTNCKMLRKEYGDLLGVGVNLDEWAAAEIERLGHIDSFASAGSDATLSETFAVEAPAIARVMHAYQRAGVAFCAATRRALLADQPGLGKAQPVSEPVLTPTGWVKMGDISVGDRVVGSDGQPTEVIGVFPQGPREIVEVTFSDGAVVRCDWDHLWQVRTKDHRRAGLPGWTKTARELKEMGLYIENGTRKRFDIPMVKPVEYESRPYPLDAYSVGVLIGDGSLSETAWAGITTDHEIVKMLDLPGAAVLVRDGGVYGEYRLNGLARSLREVGLNGTRAEQKSIPDPLLYGSVADRVSVLQGLLDTDGSPVRSRGQVSTSIEYGTVSRILAHQVRELVESLGGTASISEKTPTYTHLGEQREGQLYFRMVLHLPSGITPFRLQRKLDRWIPRSKCEPSRSIVSIEGTGVYEEAQCIRVAAADSLYVTSRHVVTHNTLQTLGTMVEAGIEGDILVAAPSAAVAITWPDELATWLPDDEFVGIMGTGPFRTKRLRQTFAAERTTKRRWIIVNLEMARMDYVAPTLEFRTPKNNPTAAPREIHVPGWYLPRYPELFYEDYEAAEEGKGKHLREWAGIVVDESHRCLVTHSTGAHAQTKVRAGMGKLALKEGGVKLALSGTPFRGKPQNLWGTLNWLYPERYSAYWDWVGRWFDVVGEPSQRPGADGDEQKREIVGLNEDLSAEFHADIAPIMLRRTKKEVRAELPDKLYAGTPLPDESGFITENSPIGHWLEMSPKQARAYKDIQEKAYTEVESGLMYANGVFAEITRLKQFATCYGDQEAYTDSKGEIRYRFIPELPSAKFDWLVEFLDNLGINKSTSQEPDEDERKVVVASQFTSILNMFERELNKKGIATLKITGQVSPKQRKAAKDRWQEPGGPRVFLLNTAAGGVSLTLDMADDLVFLDETWIPDEQEQVEDRIHRVSRMHQVTIHYLRSLGTVEERIALTTSSRERLTKLLLDGERGIATAKKLLSPVQRPKS